MDTFTKILKRGEYEGVLSKVQDKISHAKKNPMWVCHWIIIESPDSAVTILDYVVKHLTWKVGQIAKALGRLKEFEDGNFYLPDYVEARLLLTLEIETQMGFEQRNVIKGYRPLVKELFQ